MGYIRWFSSLHNTLKVVTRRCADCRVEPDFATLDLKIAIVLYDLRAMHPSEGHYIFLLASDARQVLLRPWLPIVRSEQPLLTSFCTSVILNHDFRLLLE